MGQESGSSLLAPPGGDVSFVMVQHVPALLPGSSAQHPSAPCVRQLSLPRRRALEVRCMVSPSLACEWSIPSSSVVVPQPCGKHRKCIKNWPRERVFPHFWMAKLSFVGSADVILENTVLGPHRTQAIWT